MPRYLVEALTTVSLLSGERKGLGKGRLVDVVDAPTPVDAVRHVVSATSVAEIKAGIRFRVQPFDPKLAAEVWARYENPDAPEDVNSGDPRMGDYGSVVVMQA